MGLIRGAVGGLALAALFVVMSCQKETAVPQATPANDLTVAISAYRAYAADQIDSLVAATTDFARSVTEGQYSKARAQYAPARMYYERIEPIAEAIGVLDARIDARESTDPEWTGFHRIEKFLWSGVADGSPLPTIIKSAATNLVQDTKLLRAKVESIELETADLITHAVELLNEVSATKIVGEEERYSRTDLYDVVANVEGSKKIFDLVSPALQSRDAALHAKVAAAFQALETRLAAFRTAEGYLSFDKVSKDTLKEVSRAVDALAEPLSLLPKALVPGNK